MAKAIFVKDKSIKVEVVDYNHVEYKSKVTSLFGIVQKLLKKKAL